MAKTIPFHEVLDAMEHLSVDDQESLIDILRHRIAEYRRQELSKLVLSAREEYKADTLRPESPQDIMKFILS